MNQSAIKTNVECWNCGEIYNFKGASKDELGWHVYHEKCESSHDIDITEYLVPNGTKVKIHNDWIGIIAGNDEEDTNEFENINYYVVPEGKTFDDEYMCSRSDFEIIENQHSNIF